ncbi:MAG: signal peptidase I [Actinomycetota bacterium]
MRVYELAREMDLPSKDLLVRLREFGYDAPTTPSSGVPEPAVAELRAAAILEQLEPAAAAELTVPPTDGTEHIERSRPSEISGSRPTGPDDGGRTDTSDATHPDGPDDPAHDIDGTADSEQVRLRVRRLVGRWAAMVALWLVLGLGAGFVAAITLPYVQGNRSLTVLSGSMEPAISTGDVVVVEQIPPLDARVGDIVSFRDPDDPSRLVTHRVRSMEVEQNEVEFITKGDANTSVEQWRITPDGQIGRAVFRVPKIGYVLFYLRGSLGRLLLIVLPALLLGAYELWRIWRPDPDDADDTGPADVDASEMETVK